MASRKNSVWAVLERLGHKGSRDDTIQHVFEMASRVTVRSDSGEQIDGDDFLVEVFVYWFSVNWTIRPLC